MPERIVKVRLSAQVQEYQTAMLKAADATRTVGTEAERLAQKKQAFEQLGRSAMFAGGLMAAGIGMAVKKFADFDQAMSNVVATGQDARNNIVALRDAAIEAGAKTVFSATESANALEEMAKAGVDAKDILGGGLSGALDLAAAGGLGVADAAGIAATALKIFNLEGSDMSHVADLLAAGAGKAMGDVQDLSMALAQGGQVAAATGLSIEETTAALSAFASQGLLGSDAGTSFKTMLQRLTPQSREAQAQFDALGVSAYDANGQFIGLAEFAGQLQDAMRDMTPEARNAALSVMFGSDAVRAANVIYQEGESGIRKWTAAVDDQGYAADTARERLDNLKGDVEALGGAIDSAFIQMGEAANGPLRGLVQELTAVVDGFNELPDPVKDAVFWIGAAGSAALVAGGLYLSAVPKVAEYRANLKTLGVEASRTTRVVGLAAGGLSVALVGASVVVGAFAAAQAEAKARSDELAESLDQVTGAATAATRGVVADLLTRKGEGIFGISTDSIQDWGKQLGISLEQATDAVLSNGKAFQDMSIYYQAAEGDAVALQMVMDKTGLTADLARDRSKKFTDGLDELRENAASAKEELQRQSDAQELAGDSASTAAEGVEELSTASDEAATSLDEMKDALQGVADTAMAVGETKDAVQSAINSMADAAKDAKVSLQGTNDESIAFRGSLREVEERSRAAAQAIIENGGSAKEARKEWQKGRDAIVDQIAALTGSRKEAKKWADDNLGSASEVKGALDDVYDAASRSTQLEIDTANAQAALDRIKAALNYIDTTPATVVVNMGQAGTRTRKAAGGPVVGPGTGTSDSIPALLSNGEHVIPAHEVRRAGGQQRVLEWRAAMRAGKLPAFASGGPVVSGAQLREWGRYVRRGEARADGMGGNGLSLVDKLFDIAADIGGKYGKRLAADAYKSEKAFRSLDKQAEAAATRLDKAKDKLRDLKDAAANMADRVASAVRSIFSLGDLATTQTVTTSTSSSSTVGGISVSSTGTSSTTESAATAGSIASSMKATAARIKAFSDKLKRLAKKGINSALLEELALLGVEKGEPIADALLEASASEIRDINRSYGDIGKYSTQAGDTVADANFAKLIDEAQKDRDAAKKNADDIRKKLERETTRLIKGITDALKAGRTIKRAAGGPVVGPGTDTSDSIPAMLANGENVWSAAEVRAMGGQESVERLKRLKPTPARFLYGGPVGGASAPTAAGDLLARVSHDDMQLMAREIAAALVEVRTADARDARLAVARGVRG